MQEPNYYALWVGKQTAKGTANTTPGKRLVQVGGDLGFEREDGSEPYSDLSKYGAQTDWVNSLLGQGDPALEATPTELAYMLWLHHGGEAVTAVTGPPAVSRHRFTPSAAIGHYFTAFRRVGSTVVNRHRFDDCLSTKFVLEASTANKALRYTPTILSLDPGKAFTSDPAAAIPAGTDNQPILYTDAAAAFTIDGTVYRGQSSFNLTVDDAWKAEFADAATPFELSQGRPTVALAVTLFMSTDVLAWWNTQVYGTATPTNGAAPLTGLPALGSYVATFTQSVAGVSNGQGAVVTVPKVKWKVPPAPAPNPEGGPTEVTLTGEMRPTAGGTPAPYTIDVNADDAVVAFTT